MAVLSRIGFAGNERRESNSIALSMLAAGAGITLAEILAQTIAFSHLPNGVRRVTFGLALWSFCVCQLLIWRLAAPLGPRAPIVALAATAVQLVMVTQTRGAWIWWGTFDNYRLSRWGWYTPLLIGTGAGAVLTFTLWRRKWATFATDRTTSVGLGAALVVLLLSMLLSRGEPLESEFAPTRYLALAGLMFALGLGFAFGRKEG